MASVVKRPAPIPRWFWFASLLGCTPGFRRSRCKRLLKVTMSRIKLLRGRREVQVRQLRRDVAQLLQLGQAENADSRLDRLWKEQSLLSAYIKAGEYCQLVKANLSNIALPRECPVDLKEPIASLCFAASCCADLPELQEIREIMVLKYGKDFLLSAHELFPGNLVNKTFLEAFATKEQSEVSKKALLKGILKEYNVVQPKKPIGPSSHDSQKQQSKVANSPYFDRNQNHSLLALEKEEKWQSARQTPSRPINEGLNVEHAFNGEAKKLGQHEQDRKNVHRQSEEGTTETSYDMFLTKALHDKRGRDRSRSRDHKRTTVADQVGQGDQHLSSKRKPNNKSLEPECAVINERQVYREGPLPGEDIIKGHPKSKGKVLDEKVRSERKVNDIARGQHECGEAPPLRDACEQVHGEERPTYGKNADQVFPKGQQQGPCNEQSFKAHYTQQERNLYYEEENHVERDVYSRSNGYSRSKRVMHDFEKTRSKKGMPHSDCGYVKTNSERHSKSNRRLMPAGECDNNMQKMTSFHSHHREHKESRTGYEFESQQPSWRVNGAWPEHQDAEKMRQERRHSSKNSLCNEIAEIEASAGAYPHSHVSQKARKKLVKNHYWADKQEEIGANFSELLPDQAAKVSPPLHKCYEDYEYQLKETARQTIKNLHKTQNHVTEAGVKTKTETHNETRPHEPAVEHCVDEGHVLENSNIHARQRHSRRTKKHNLEHITSRRKLLNGNLVNEEPLQETFAEENVNGKTSLAGHINGSLTLENDSIQRERGHFPVSIAWRGSERNFYAAEAKYEHQGYGVDQVSGAQKIDSNPENCEDHEGAEVKERSCQLEKGSLLSSRFSKPPDRSPPPIPPHRMSSLPSRQPLSSPPVLPQRCVTLETSHIRGIQEPHVHPKLPDYEDLVASFAALRNKPHSSSSS